MQAQRSPELRQLPLTPGDRLRRGEDLPGVTLAGPVAEAVPARHCTERGRLLRDGAVARVTLGLLHGPKTLLIKG
eukprot:15470671-Alexandrium_andersonii.AAC.1